MKSRLIKRCPCCNSKKVKAQQYVIEASVRCEKCGLNMVVGQSIKKEQLEKAIKKWNKRVNED